MSEFRYIMRGMGKQSYPYMILTAMFYTCLAGTEHKAQFRFDFKGQAGLAEADMLRHGFCGRMYIDILIG
ncbi:hypothetical protein K070079E91_37760 [Eisenbergiella porci]